MNVRAIVGCAVASCLLSNPGFAVEEQALRVPIPVPQLEISAVQEHHELVLADYGMLMVPGCPDLPSRIFAVAVPPGAQVVGVAYDLGEAVQLPGSYSVAPVALPRVLSGENPLVAMQERAAYQATYEATYGSDAVYPSEQVEFVRSAGYRQYNLADIRVTPFAYQPQSGTLVYYPDISVTVTYTTPDVPKRVSEVRLISAEETARRTILNYDQAQAWYPGSKTLDRGLHDFVIITLDTLVGSVQTLAAWETSKGRTVEVVTTTWIDSNYSGYDLAEKMRNFLRDKYPANEWGIQDVLLVGHYDHVPMRRTWQDVGYGMPETDYYYAELSLSDAQSWDANVNRRWGEDSDPVDFYPEVNVGRIPWSGSTTVQGVCNKSADYEANTDPGFKKNILLAGGYFWADTDNAYLMEAKVDQPWMSDWTMTRMYEQNADYYSSWPCDYPLLRANMVSVWGGGTFAFVNWAGHGSPTSCHIYGLGVPAFIAGSDCSNLNDQYPSIVFADACSNSDTDYTNIGQSMLQKGAVGFVGATKVAYGSGGWRNVNDGSSQSMDYLFTTYVTSTDYTQGQAHQEALRYMYTHGLWYYVRYEMFEWGALWGNPDLGMGFVPPLTIGFPDGLPDYLDPGVSTSINVTITNGMEDYVPGSGLLHCRLDGGAFQTVPLLELGGGLCEAVLPPAACTDLPEYYVSAQGNGGSTVTNPHGAPADAHTAIVGDLVTVLSDDFETDLGWTVSGNASTGMWERGTPSGGGDRGDPTSDFDGSGQCYVTQNGAGDTDIDGGYTYLDSPAFDLSDGDADISYALWYTNNFGGDPNNDLFKTYVSANDGASWMLVETVGPASSAGWFVHTFRVGDFVTPTAQVRVRFEASDLNDGSVVEAGIDALTISRLDCNDVDCPEDLNGDGFVGQADLGLLLASYGIDNGGDIDGDGDTDQADLGALLAVYDTDCS